MELKELLGEELYNQVIAKAGDKHKIALVSDGNWLPKDKFNEAITARKNAEDTLKERDKQLEQLKKDAGDNAQLKEQIDKLQAENKAAKDKYEADAKELRLGTAVKLALSGKVHDPDIVAGLLDKSKIELDDNGGIKAGLEDQIKALQTSKAFLFTPTQPGTRYRGTSPVNPNRQTQAPEITQLEADYQKAVQSRNMPLQIALKNQIFELQKGTGDI